MRITVAEEIEICLWTYKHSPRNLILDPSRPFQTPVASALCDQSVPARSHVPQNQGMVGEQGHQVKTPEKSNCQRNFMVNQLKENQAVFFHGPLPKSHVQKFSAYKTNVYFLKPYRAPGVECIYYSPHFFYGSDVLFIFHSMMATLQNSAKVFH